MRFLLVLLSLSSVWAGSVCSVKEPTSCDELSREVASRFVCSDAQSNECIIALNDQFSAIAAIDYPGIEQTLTSIRSVVLQCSGHRLCTPIFLSCMTRARLPASVAQAVAFNSSSADLFDILDRKCGRTWALQNCDVNGCPERNVTCESERDMAAFLVQVAKMSVFYSARRENKHLQNILNIACPNQGPECASFVSARLAESSAWISANTPTIFDRAMFASPSFARELEKRQCGGEFPCMQDFLNPLLTARDLEMATQSLQAANDSFTRPVFSQNIEDEIFSLLSQPSVSCNSLEGSDKPDYCEALKIQREKVWHVLVHNFSIGSRMTSSLKSRYQTAISQCWSGCYLLLISRWPFLQNSVFLEEMFETYLRYAFLLCDSTQCIDAVFQRLASYPWMKFIMPKDTNIVINNRVFLVTGLILQCALIVMSVGILIVICFVWKVARAAFAYILILVLLVISETFQLTYWASLMRIFDGVQTHIAAVVLQRSRFVVLFLIFIGLSLKWIFALFVLFSRNPPSAKAELIIQISVWAVSGVFAVLVIAFQLLTIRTTGANSDEMERLSRVTVGNLVLVITIRSLLVLMSGFLAFCAASGLVVLKRSGSASISALQGMTRLLIVSIFLFFSYVCQYAFFMAEQRVDVFVLENRVFLPEWLRFVIDRQLLHAIQSCCLLFIAFMASKQFVRQSSSVGNSLNDKLLQKEDNEQEGRRDSVPLSYQI